jgi:plastocyanin
MNTTTIVGILAAIVLIGGGAWYYMSMAPAGSMTGDSYLGASTGDAMQNGNNASNGQGSTTVNINIDASTNGGATSAAVTLTSNGFSPKTVTIKKGGTVTWTNEGTGGMWVASGNHPTHTVYDGTSEEEHCAPGYSGAAPFDQCSNSSSYSFTFDEVGSWNYHNHTNASQTGTVVVTE